MKITSGHIFDITFNSNNIFQNRKKQKLSPINNRPQGIVRFSKNYRRKKKCGPERLLQKLVKTGYAGNLA
jgi:hypothetical protein